MSQNIVEFVTIHIVLNRIAILVYQIVLLITRNLTTINVNTLCIADAILIFRIMQDELALCLRFSYFVSNLSCEFVNICTALAKNHFHHPSIEQI